MTTVPELMAELAGESLPDSKNKKFSSDFPSQ